MDILKIPALLSAADAAGLTEQAEAAGNALEINGPAVVYDFGFKIFGMDVLLTDSVTVQWVIMLILGILFFVLGRNLEVKPKGKRQAIAEMIVTTISGMVDDTMGVKYRRYIPYIGALMAFSFTLSISGLMGFRPPTADFSVIAAWGLITFILVERNRFKTGKLVGGVKSFFEPMPFLLPLNLLGEITNPVSQMFRHYGNILGGCVIGTIVYWAMGNFALVVPGVLSLYFDLFSAGIQAFIFCTLTMVYVSMADCTPEEKPA